MTRRVIISRDPLDAEAYEIHDNVLDVPGFLMTQFTSWPDGARIYHEHVSQDHDVTPSDAATIERLNELDGDLYVVVYPEGFIAIIFVIIAVVALVAAVVLLKPAVPDAAANRNQQSSSPNNELAARTNRPRLNARIPEIYGIVRSTPDMLSPEYKYYEANRKVEVAYMCVGRGLFSVYDVKDGDTLLNFIAGSAAAFYNPNTSPNSGHAPFLSVGSPIDEPLFRAKKLEQVIGQELRPPNAGSYSNRNDIKFQFPDRIYNSTGLNFQDKFVIDDQILVSGAVFTGVSATVTQTAISRYVWNSGTPYVEWQAGNPQNFFVNGDDLIISNASYTGAIDSFTVRYPSSGSRIMDLYNNGRIYFFNNEEPVGDLGMDFRANKNFTLSNASWTNSFSGAYVIDNRPSSSIIKITDDGLKDWHRINTVTDYIDCTIQGISRRARFYTDGRVELEAGNFDDVVGTTLTLSSNCSITYDVSGVYQYTSRNAGSDYWQLNNPSSVDSDWNAIRVGHEPAINGSISQVHSTDTESVNFNGTYNISSMTSTRIYLSSPAAVNSNWNRLQFYVNNRVEYSTSDTFQVVNPTRTVNLNGTYTLVGVGLYEMFVSFPAGVSDDWNKLEFFANDEVNPTGVTIQTTSANFIGPFFLDSANLSRVYSSFLAPNGLYKDDGKDQTRAQVEIQMLLYPATSAGVGNGQPVLDIRQTMTGSAIQRDSIGVTRKIGLSGANLGYNLMYARRLTAKDTAFEGQVVDTVQWEEVYLLDPEPLTQFGDITTVHTRTYATGGALALKERKLNCLVGRKIPIITGFSGTFPNQTPVYAADPAVSTDAAQIFCALSLDPKFGARQASEIDFVNIFTARSAVEAYFASTDATRFMYTFDNTNVSYEEAANAIANAAFCTAYRQGSVIKWKPEIATNDSVLVFNHRNKIPDTESRTIRFGANNDNDSIQLEWVNPDDDAIETFFIPEDQSGSAPKKIETIGIRNIAQATWHAWRSYYKTLYQNVVVEFESTQEAGLLIPRDRVLVADNTRADVQDGEVWDQSVLQLTLSQEVTLASGVSYTIFLQHVDGTVEAIPITAVPSNVSVIKNSYMLKEGGFRWAIPAEVGIFSVGDVVVLTGAAVTDPVNGSQNLAGTYTVSSVDGISGIVLFDQPWLVNNNWLDLTQTEILRVGANFASTKNSKRKVNLQYAPRLPLNMDPEAYSRATYLIRGNDEVGVAAFQVQETRPRDNFTYQVSLTNYDPRFYYLDDLQFWLNFDDQTFRDASARAHNVSITTSAGKATIAYNNTRKSYCFYNATNATAARINSSDLIGTRGSYTKAFWIQQGAGFDSFFLSNAYEQFRVNNSNRIIAGHNVGGVTALTVNAWPSSDGNWHHAACVYDEPAKILKVFIDGVKVGQRTNVQPPSVAAVLQPVGLNSAGVAHPWADDVRYWKRAFSEGEILELYNGTR